MARFTYTTPLLMISMLALTACPGDDVSIDTEGTTTGDESTTTAGPTTTPPTTTTADTTDATATDTVADTTTTGDDPCAGVECPPGEECIGGACFECGLPTCEAECAEGEVCACPEDDLCCDVGSCMPLECPGAALPGNYADCLDEMGMTSDEPCDGGGCVVDNDAAPTAAACVTAGCDYACQCPPHPGTGEAVVTCEDVTGDMVNDCWLDCGGGATCPDDMVCFGGFICLWSDVPPTEVPLYGDCYNQPGATCENGGICLQAPDGGVCSVPCGDVMDCEPAPATGDAPITCSDVTGDMMSECWLGCTMGETCPDGMTCFGGFVCVWPEAPTPDPGYGNCGAPGVTCAANEVCIDDGMGMMDPTWAVCAQDACAAPADCVNVVPAGGTAVAACGDPTGMGGANACYLDCSGGDTCPDGMACVNGTACSWPQGAVLFADDFETGDFSAGWTLNNVDGLTPAMQTNFVTDAWVVGDIEMGNNTAISTSWYMPAGVSDDWLISPQIMLGAGSRLYWVSRSTDPGFPDDFEVRISTAGTTVMDFEANPPLLVVAPEADEYVFHYVDLAAAGYANQNVHVAFRNVTNDGNLLLVDNVSVVNIP